MKQRPVIGSVASNTVISMLTTARMKEGQKPSKMLNWRHCIDVLAIFSSNKKPLIKEEEVEEEEGGIARWGFAPKARRAYFSIRSYPPSHFQTIICVGNDSKTRNLGSLWFEAKGRWASFVRMWTTASAVKKEGFSSLHRDGWWKMDSLHQPKKEKVMGTAMLLPRRFGWIFTLRRLCCVFGGPRSVSFIMSCWNRTKPSLRNGIERNWCVWAEHCTKNGHNTSSDTKKWSYTMTTLGLMLPNPLKRHFFTLSPYPNHWKIPLSVIQM